MRFAWPAQGFRALRCRCFKPPTQNPRKGCKFHVTEVLLCSDHFAWQLQEFVCLGSTFSWRAQYFWSIRLRSLKRIGQVSGRHVIFKGSLAQRFRFWASMFHFWKKSRKNAVFLSFKASFLKEVSQKSLVFEIPNFNFLKWVSQGGRKKRYRPQFKGPNFNKPRNHHHFVTPPPSHPSGVWWCHPCVGFSAATQAEIPNLKFEGSLAEKLCFCVS